MLTPEKAERLKELLRESAGLYEQFMTMVATKDAGAQRAQITYKATAGIDQPLGAIRAAYAAGDAAAYDRAVAALAQFRPTQRQPTGTAASKRSDVTARPRVAATTKDSNDPIMDGVTGWLQAGGDPRCR